MRGNYRRKNRRQGQQEVRFEQARFDGGWVNDLPGSDLPKDTMALLENFNAYPEYLEGRSGTQLYSSLTLPGSGTIYALKQHPVSKIWVLHRGSSLYYSTAAMSSWVSILNYGSNANATINGDTGSQLSGLYLTHASLSNTDSNVLYWNLTNSGSVRTLNVYKNSAKNQLVASGTRTGNGYMYLLQQNDSMLGGSVTVTYSGDDTDSGNTVTDIGPTDTGVIFNTDSTLEAIGNDFWLFVKHVNGQQYKHVYIDLTNLRHITMNHVALTGYGGYVIAASGSQGSSTPYGYRYAYTFTRIVSATTGLPVASETRTTGTLVFESPSNYIGGSITGKDYGEYWLASAIASGAANTVILTQNGSLSSQTLAESSAVHYTHISLYRTMDIGVAGVDPVTGSGNNREIYVWVGDYDYTKASVSDAVPDDELRARLGAGFGLKTRFWKELPTGEVGVTTNGFMYTARRGENTVFYSQIVNKQNLGFYNPAFQYLKLNDGIQLAAKSPDMVSFICNNKTYISNPNSYITSGAAYAPVYVLQHLTIASSNIGCLDWGSFAEIDSGNQLGNYGSGGSTGYIARCSDNTIRVWNNSFWSNDLSSRRVNKTVQQMLVGSVGAYWKGVYKIYYRTSATTNTTACLRFGMTTDAGSGWSSETGSALPLPQTYLGAGSFIDANGVQRMYVLDAADGLFYWTETFDSYTGASLTKYFLDKVAINGTGGTAFTCKARFREVTGPDEGMDLLHKEAHIFDRPYSEAAGFLSGFTRNYLAYVDGSSTAASTLTGTARNADLQFFDTVSGVRIQPEVQFSRSGARLTGFEALFDAQDKTTIGNGPSSYTDATNQAALAQNMKVWLTRPGNLLNRASGTSFTLTGTAPTNVTGPDGKTYGLSFVSGASYSVAETTSYTDFTLHFWVKAPAFASKVVWIVGGAANFYAQFASNTALTINGAGNLTVSSVASGWHDFWIVRSGSTVTAYQNGALVSGSVTVAAACGGSTFQVNSDAGIMSVYDVRAYNTTVSAAAIAYYYADVTTTLQGNKVLPLG